MVDNVMKLTRVKLLEGLEHTFDHLGDACYSITELKKPNFNLEALNEDFLVLSRKDEHDWLEFCFLEVNSRELPYSEDSTLCTVLWHGEGPSGSMRECRHSYIGEDGYVFYVSKKNFTAALEWLERHYDLN